jgi:N-acetylmuramic acid 6-phosphate etherase
MPVTAAIRLMLAEDATLPAALLREEKKIVRAIGLIVRGFRRGGRLFYVGAGTSGRLGALDAYECPPTFSVPPEMTQAIVAGGDQASAGAHSFGALSPRHASPGPPPFWCASTRTW